MKGDANEHFACILSQSSSSPPLFPTDGENEELGFCFLLRLNNRIFCRLRRSPMKKVLIMVMHGNKYVNGEHPSAMKAEEVFI